MTVTDTECAHTEVAPALSVSIKLSSGEVAAIDLFARGMESELRAAGMRIAVSRAAAIRSLLDRGMAAAAIRETPASAAPTTESHAASVLSRHPPITLKETIDP